MRVLRIGMTYPRDSEPGIGQHNRYHSMYSPYEELILTAKRNGKLLPNRPGVEVVEIDAENPQLGKYTDSKRKRIFSAAKKISSQIRFFKLAKHYIDDYKPELVHIYTPIPILCALYAKRKYQSKIVISLHGSDALRMSKVPVFANTLKTADAVVTVSDNMCSPSLLKKAKGRVVCIGNGVDLETFKPLQYQREKLFIHVASLRWQKGQQYLLRGFASFYEEHPEYKLLIIGDGEEKTTLIKLCEELGIKDNVIFAGIKSREFIAEALNKSLAFVLTSVTEGFPKVIIEAMATGTPVISSDAGNVKSVVGEAGIICPIQDSDSICRAMEMVSTDETLWKKMSSVAYTSAKQYSWQAHVEKLNAVYDNVMGSF